ncbi:hypothetical protein [Burkholderia ambifaria]|uniref:hypothetical protein n=1 Tax=Burkholderia ambifaria TaxID=152480 RepID=UPI00158B3E9B|nr:hypothetical protein [Burkholderia ambifaria]
MARSLEKIDSVRISHPTARVLYNNATSAIEHGYSMLAKNPSKIEDKKKARLNESSKILKSLVTKVANREISSKTAKINHLKTQTRKINGEINFIKKAWTLKCLWKRLLL